MKQQKQKELSKSNMKTPLKMASRKTNSSPNVLVSALGKTNGDQEGHKDDKVGVNR